MRKHKLLIAVITFGLTWIAIVRAEDQPIEQQLVDAMNKVFGVHPGFRANHAKGICRRQLQGLSRGGRTEPGGIVQRQLDSGDSAIL